MNFPPISGQTKRFDSALWRFTQASRLKWQVEGNSSQVWKWLFIVFNQSQTPRKLKLTAHKYGNSFSFVFNQSSTTSILKDVGFLPIGFMASRRAAAVAEFVHLFSISSSLLLESSKRPVVRTSPSDSEDWKLFFN